MAKILIIDDDGIVRDALAVFLTREGHEVLTAADGGNGVLLFRNSLPDLVILDRDLPVISGSAVFQKIREVSKAVPVMILTGYDAPEDAEAYLADGAACFLSKGDGLSNVLEEIGRILGTPAHPGDIRQYGRAANGARARLRSRALILVADDDAAILNVLTRFLTEQGYKVIAAADGLAAEKLALERKPDLILLDIYMPGKDGVEVLKTVLAEEPGTGVIMITGNDDIEVAKSCLRLGAFDYLPKPVNLDALQARIAARLVLQKGEEPSA
ncbi:MAG: response regulator [Elusimicrobiales bacterium]